MSEDNGYSWPAVDVEPAPTRAPDDALPDDDIPSILELAGIAEPEGAHPEPPLSEVPPPAAPVRVASGWDVEAASRLLTDLRPDPLPDEPPPDAAPHAGPALAPVVEHESIPELEPVPAPQPAPEAAPTPAPAPPTALPRPPLPRVMAVANQKGGVGKTTTAVNLGAALAEMGYRVLIVDLDPQGNATTGVGVNARNLQTSIYDVLLADLPMEDCIEPTAVRNLFVAPAMIDLAGAEIELVPAFSRELRLRRAIDRMDGDFDFIIIDCPPSLGLLTVNGLAAATEVVVPIQCEYYALEGLGQLMRNVQLVQRNLNPRLELSTIILTMYDARTKLAEQVAKEVRKHFGAKVCRNIVPRTVRLSEAPSFGQPIIVFDSTSRGALAYRELAKEVSGGAPQRTR
ncbi:MAG: chromosome partitioning protein [Actinomycetota bacterium]|nr:chromosome partitioning protein [Actinomycetota bacterium]